MSVSILDSIEKAIEIRAGFFGRKTDAYRLFDGAGDGREGVFIDDFAGHWLVQTKGVDLPEELRKGVLEGCRSLWWKRLEQSERQSPEWIRGERPDGPFEVMENGCRFLADFEAGYSQGLFLDQRLNRARVLERVKGGDRVLNCFAYSCGFSVVAAVGGASTTSVDLSAPYLDWGKENFGLNGIDPEEHEFQRGDVAELLKRFARRRHSFDGIILDPPTFSRNRSGRIFRVEKDFGELVAQAARIVAPGGWVLCCSNARTLKDGAMERMVRAGLEEASRASAELRPVRMPPEYRGEKYLKSLWIEVVS